MLKSNYTRLDNLTLLFNLANIVKQTRHGQSIIRIIKCPPAGEDIGILNQEIDKQVQSMRGDL